MEAGVDELLQKGWAEVPGGSRERNICNGWHCLVDNKYHA